MIQKPSCSGLSEVRMIFIPALLILFGVSNSFAQKNSINLPKEKIYISTDRDVYIVGDTVRFMVFLRNAENHKPASISHVAYVDLINWQTEEIVASRNIEIINGIGCGDLQIPVKDESSIGIRGYTRYMQNFDDGYLFRKELRVLLSEKMMEELSSRKVKKVDRKKVNRRRKRNDIEPKPSLRFFPEGGHLVKGLESIVGVEAKDHLGNPIQIEGTVKDQKGKPVVKFKTNEVGLGKFIYIAQNASTLTGEITWNDIPYSYDIPEPLETGYVLSVNGRGKDIYIKINGIDDIRGATIVGMHKGMQFFQHQIEENVTEQLIKIKSEELPTGLSLITLFDASHRPQAERLLFCNLEKTIHSTQIEQASSGVDSLAIGIKFESDISDSVDFALSITDKRFSSEISSNIISYFNLESEIKGRIHNAYGYFDGNISPAIRNYNLDLLLLTQGWRKFLWRDSVKSSVYGLPYLPETNGFNIKVETSDFYKSEEAIPANVDIFSFLPLIMETVKTDAHATAYFTGLALYDTTRLFLSANKSKQHKLKKSGKVKFKGERARVAYDTQSAKVNKNYFLTTDKGDSTQAQPIWNDMALRFHYNDIYLEEIVVEGRATDETIEYFKDRTRMYSSPSHRIVLREDNRYIYNNPFDVLRGIPGVQVVGDRVSIRQSEAAPLFLLDGMPIDHEFISTFSVQDIEFVDVLKGPMAAIYGSRGGGGVIAFYTIRGNSPLNPGVEGVDAGIVHLTHPGFYKSKKRYQPILNTSNEFTAAPVLHWQVATSGSPEPFKVNIPRVNGKFKVKVEGISKSGKIYSGIYDME